MKTTILYAFLISACLALVCLAENQSAVKTAAANRFKANVAAPLPAPTPRKKSDVLDAPKKSPPLEPLPKKIDDDSAVSPVYKINSKNCKDRDGQGTEGEDILRKCTGYGDYSLFAYGFDYRINYRIESNDAGGEFFVVLFPLETGEAAKYARADLYDEKLAEKLEWRLDAKGKPFAVIVRASFYKNTGSAKTFANPKNRVAEFVFVRGLKGFEDLKVDVPTVDTAFNPDEQARVIAAEYFEKHKK